MAIPFAPIGFTLLAFGSWAEWRKHRASVNPIDIKGNSRNLKGLGQTTALPALGPRKVSSYKTTTVRTIKQRADYIAKNLIEGSKDPAIVTAVDLILSEKCRTMDGGKRWCINPKDAWAECRALFSAVTNPNSPFAVRYRNDNAYVDEFRSANLLMRTNNGDCDDFTIYLGAMLVQAGFPVMMRIIQDSGSDTWSHIYLMVDVAKGGNKWVALDPTEPQHQPGWQLEGANQCAASGRPAGKVLAVLDVPIEEYKWPKAQADASVVKTGINGYRRGR